MKEARRAGFTSTGQIIAQTGNGLDRDELWQELEDENEEASRRNLVLTSDAASILGRGESDGNAIAPPVPVPVGGPNQANPQSPDEGTRQVAELTLVRQERMLEGLALRIAEGVSRFTAQAVREAMSMVPPTPVINISPQPVHVHAPDIHVTTPDVNVTTPDIKVDVAAPQVNVTTPDIKVDVAAPEVNVTTPEVRVDAPISVSIPEQTVKLEMPQNEIESAEVLERDAGRLARVVRTNRGEFEIVERDANGDVRVVKRRNVA